MIVLALVLVIIGLEWVLPFWAWVAAAPFVYGLLFEKKSGRALLRGFAAGGLSWLGGSLYFYLTSSRIVAGRVAAMLGLGSDRGWIMVLATGLIGAIIAGLAAFAGSSLRGGLQAKRSGA
jgi:hypothetical protein